MNNDEIAEELAGFNMKHTHIHSRADELIACLEGEIAKRDARIEAQEAQIKILQSDANSWQSGYDEGRRMGSKYASTNAQEPVAWETPSGGIYREKKVAEMGFRGESVCKVTPLFRYAAPVSEAKAQGVVMPAELARAFITGESCNGVYRVVIQSETLNEMHTIHRLISSLSAATAAPAADAGLVEALALCVKSLDQLLPYLGKVPEDIGLLNNALMAARPALAAHRAKGVV